MTFDDNSRSDVSLVRITASDVRRSTDLLAAFVQRIGENEAMYPDIGTWLRAKVLPGIRERSRSGWLVTMDGKPIGAAVVKQGRNAKFCHLQLSADFRHTNVGGMLFILMAYEVRALAKRIFFTLPESLWEEKKEFFKSFGFLDASTSSVQYRLFDRELECSALQMSVWRHVREKILDPTQFVTSSGRSQCPQLLLSLKPEFARKVLLGIKTVEIRNRFSRRWEGRSVAIYASGNVRALVGEAVIKKVQYGTPIDLWRRYSENIGCDYERFMKYVGEREEACALELAEVDPYSHPVPIAEIEAIGKEELRPPQSHMELERNNPWSRAVPITSLLQSRVCHVRGTAVETFTACSEEEKADALGRAKRARGVQATNLHLWR